MFYFGLHHQYFKIQLGRLAAPYLQWGGAPLLTIPPAHAYVGYTL